MLAAFESQNAPSLVATRSYPDRLVAFDRHAARRTPFDFRWSYLRFVLAVRRVLPPRLVDRLLPVQLGTIGRECNLTDWSEEWTTASDAMTVLCSSEAAAGGDFRLLLLKCAAAWEAAARHEKATG